MKKVIAGVILAVAMAGAALAQTVRSKLTEDQKAALKTKMETYKAELNLTAVQQSKFEEINLQFAEALAELKEEKGSRLSKYRKLKTANDLRNKKMKDMLTPDQYKIFTAHQGDLKEELKSRREKN